VRGPLHIRNFLIAASRRIERRENAARMQSKSLLEPMFRVCRRGRQSFGAFLSDGMTLKMMGEAND